VEGSQGLLAVVVVLVALAWLAASALPPEVAAAVTAPATQAMARIVRADRRMSLLF
jgi:hypothetical protein